MKYTFLCIVFFNFGHSIFSQTTSIPLEYKEVCDYSNLLTKNNTDAKEVLVKEELYLELLGILNELADYRVEFLKNGSFINLFPTAYFHTTAKEMINIAKGEYDYPIEKMQQMVAFYEAYKYNRFYWDTNQLGKVEKHWKIHFEQSLTTKSDYTFFTGIDFFFKIERQFDKSLSTAVDAHVNIDLARAVRFAFRNRPKQSVTKDNLWQEFEATNPIFANTQNKVIKDFSFIYPSEVWAKSSYRTILNISGLILGPNVKKMRTTAWQQAFDTTPLLEHPLFLNHQQLIQKGKSGCSFSTGIYGVTIITHGFQPPAIGSAPVNSGEWARVMAETIRERAGAGEIRIYNKSSGRFVHASGEKNKGELILLFDWASESGRDINGFSEAAGDALFMALLLGQRLGDFTLNNLHLIGHSRGTVVNTEAAERLLTTGYKIDQITNIDAHDWGGIKISSDHDNHPNLHIPYPANRTPNNGVIAWKGIPFIDSYWQDNFALKIKSSFPPKPTINFNILDGRPVDGTFNDKWNDYADSHTDIHSIYTKTIADWATVPNGYKYARLIGKSRPSPNSPNPLKYTPKYSPYERLNTIGNSRIRGIMNGSFDRGQIANIPGWEEHGGEVSDRGVRIVNGQIEMEDYIGSHPLIRHNRFYIPKDVQCISVKLKKVSPNEGTLNIQIKDWETGLTEELALNKEIEDIGDVFEEAYIDISNFQDKIVTLQFEVKSKAQGANFKIAIDEIDFSKQGCQKELTLFLFDNSGSMSEGNKYVEAKKAGLETLNQLKQEAKQSGKTPSVGIMTFAGGCVDNPTWMPNPFSTDLDLVENIINSVPYPGGNTPLPQALVQAEKKLQAELETNGQSCGDLIVLGDGQSTCGQIRPPQAYAGVQSKKNLCGQGPNGKPTVTYYTVGFGIQPGSLAERDLQYLALSSGGKYFNAKNQYQLTRAFQKINKIYTPLNEPETTDLDSVATSLFYGGNAFVYAEQYDTALVLYQKFYEAHPSDLAGLYNLALMSEANERYKAAANYLTQYIAQKPDLPNRAELEKYIQTLNKDYRIFLDYMKEFLVSDLGYLSAHYQQLLNTPNAVPLAGEFSGFIREKYLFYQELSDRLEIEETWLTNYAKEISQAFRQAVYFLDSNPQQWDLDGIAMLGNVHYPLERLVTKIQANY